MSFEVKEINEAYFNGSNFASVMRGIHIAVYIMAVSQIYTGPERTTQSRKLMTVLVTLFFVMSTIHHASYWAYVHRAFITRGATAESTAESLNEYPTWYIGTTSVSDVNAILADCVIRPAAFSVIAIFQTVTDTSFGVVGVDYATGLYSTSLATTLYCTVVIIYRVVQVGSRSTAGPGLRSYRGVIEILVESSALYFVATLFALVAYTRSGPASQYASAFWTSVTGIAPTLVVARVAAGDARPNQTWNEEAPPLSFLRFIRMFDGLTTGTGTGTGTMSMHTHEKSVHTETYVEHHELPRTRIRALSLSDEEINM
ncbi:hypothetical protein D9615_002699 [Tricholomella constricta]|uniref:Uncharacterized protein n=1 Tax=Tricholomella constricta TaxID=117010 RepID=A0A8H5HMJ4_9AGAR|nr:hypothetical protein D9615_002699 [Tricholomella constricta]